MDKLRGAKLRTDILAALGKLDLYKGCKFVETVFVGHRWLISTKQRERYLVFFSRDVIQKVLEITWPEGEGMSVRLAVKTGNLKAGDIVEGIIKEAGLKVERHMLD